MSSSATSAQSSRGAPAPELGTWPDGAILTDVGQVDAIDGTRLHYRRWLPAGRPAQALVVFVHGIASHGGWFAETAMQLARGGIGVYAPDRRGSGLSDGPPGHLPSFEQALDDLEIVVGHVRSEQPTAPIFLAASSWSAKLALPFVATTPTRLAGLVLLGPGLFPRVGLTVAQRLTLLALHRVRPEWRMPIPLRPESYTFEPAALAFIRSDEHRLLHATARFYWETGRLDRARDRYAREIRIPLLVQLGDADPIMDIEATTRWVNRLPVPDRTLALYRGAAHTLDFEPEPTVRVYRADLLGWLRRQAAREAARVG